jgi:acyl carrier protein
MTDFYSQLAEVLELDEIVPEQDLQDLPEWDSLSALSVIAMVHSNYRVAVSAAELKNATTAQALQELVARKTGL